MAFECLRCGNCCIQPGWVYLDPGEEERAALFLNMEVRSFIDKFCELVERRRLVFKKFSDERCIFLTPEGCRIHPVKPKQCREFPRIWSTPRSLDYCEGLKHAAPES